MKTSIIAHRGDSGNAPENTLAAFERAWHLNVDYIEFDYHHSRDGIPVVIHDATVDRTTDTLARGYPAGTRVDSLSLSELAALDATRGHNGRWSAFRPCPLPTVEAVLRSALALNRQCVIERKSGDSATLCRLLADLNATEYVIVISFESEGGWEFLAECQAQGIETAYLLNNDLSEARIDRLVNEFQATRLNCNHNLLTAPLLETLRARNLEVWAWTVNDMERARTLEGWGVRAITTDYPAMLLQELHSHSA